jgi:hypothetical protein
MTRNSSRAGTPTLVEALLASTLKSRRTDVAKKIYSIDIVRSEHFFLLLMRVLLLDEQLVRYI